MVLRSYPVSRLMARMLSPCRFNSSISCTSFPRNTSRLLLHSRVDAGLQPRLGGGGFFERHYGDFTTGADTMVFGIIPECRSAFLRNKRSASPESPTPDGNAVTFPLQ